MSTALDLITDASLLAGVLGHGESLDTNEQALGLRLLNNMLESWSLENLLCYQITEGNFALTSGTASYSTTLLGARIAQGNPEYVFVRISNIDYPLELISNTDYSQIPTKTVGGIPDRVNYTQNYPNGTFTFYPVPSTGQTAYVGFLALLQSFALTSTAVALPPGFEEAIKYNLALRLSLGQPVPEDIRLVARESKATIKRPQVSRGTLRTWGERTNPIARFNRGF